MTVDRIYRLLLCCYPAEFRQEYGSQMTGVWQERARSEPSLALWLEILGDLARTAPKEHLDVILHDLVYAARTLRRSPAVTAAVVLTLALAIGATTAIFSAANAIVFDPLPYPRADRIVRIWESNLRANQPFFSASIPNFVSWREQTRSFSQLALFRTGGVIVTLGDEPVRVTSSMVSGSMLDMLGIQPLHGRGIVAADEAPEAPLAIVLTRSFWVKRFGADPAVVGKGLLYGGENAVVAGVVPDDRVIFRDVDMFVPVKIAVTQKGRGNHIVRAIARLRDGVTIEQADAEMKTVAANLARQYPATNGDWSARLQPAFEWIVPEELRRGLAVMLAAVGMVLLIACANISNLMLARAASRSQEMAVRKALGAGNPRLVRQLLTESALVAVLGGAAGVLAAWWGVAALRGAMPADWPRTAEVAVSRQVLLFSALITLVAGILFGLAPAWQAARTQVSDALKIGGRGATGGGRGIRRVLVALQLAMATALATGAGLFVESLWNLQHARLGFAPDHLLLAKIGFPGSRYPDDERRWQLCRQVLAEMKSAPGVRAAGAANQAPFEGGFTAGEAFPVGASALAPTEQFFPEWRIVDPDYFQALRIPLKAGRVFTGQDTGERALLIVSESYARKLWPGENAVGRQVRTGGTVRTIVGVAGDVRNLELGKEPGPINYLPATAGAGLPMTVLVRTEGDPLAMAPTLRERVKRVDRTVPVFDIRSMDQLVRANSARARWNTLLIGGFAALALVLAAVGIYGVLAYAVTLRTREIGVRMALGASARDVIRMVVREGLVLAAAGIGVGVALALALGRLAATLLYGVSPHDLATFAGVAAALAAVALAASVIPARRAAQVDPLAALRAE